VGLKAAGARQEERKRKQKRIWGGRRNKLSEWRYWQGQLSTDHSLCKSWKLLIYTSHERTPSLTSSWSGKFRKPKELGWCTMWGSNHGLK